jgi:hypothetical protein
MTMDRAVDALIGLAADMADTALPGLLAMTRAAIYRDCEELWTHAGTRRHRVNGVLVSRITARASRAKLPPVDGRGLALIAGMLICSAAATRERAAKCLPEGLANLQLDAGKVLSIDPAKFWDSVYNELAETASQQGWI